MKDKRAGVFKRTAPSPVTAQHRVHQSKPALTLEPAPHEQSSSPAPLHHGERKVCTFIAENEEMRQRHHSLNAIYADRRRAHEGKRAICQQRRKRMDEAGGCERVVVFFLFFYFKTQPISDSGSCESARSRSR